MTNLTNNEKQLLKIMNRNHDHNGCTFAHDIRPDIAEGQILGLDVKGARGVLSSLIQKKVVIKWTEIEDEHGKHETFLTKHMIEDGYIEDDITWEEMINR